MLRQVRVLGPFCPFQKDSRVQSTDLTFVPALESFPVSSSTFTSRETRHRDCASASRAAGRCSGDRFLEITRAPPARTPLLSSAFDSFAVSGSLLISPFLSFLLFSTLGSADRASSALFRSSLFERQLLQMQREQQSVPQHQLPDLSLG